MCPHVELVSVFLAEIAVSVQIKVYQIEFMTLPEMIKKPESPAWIIAV